MGYRIKPTSAKPGFKILFEWIDKGNRQTKSIPKDQWGDKGFRLNMTIEEAKARKDQLNAQEKIKRTEKERQKIVVRLETEKLAQTAWFPPADLRDFEEKQGIPDKPKRSSYWNKARTIIEEIGLSPEDWDEHSERFYRAFIRHEMSPAYVEKVRPMINAWGTFCARRYKLPFIELKHPPKGWAKQIAEAHYKKKRGRGNKESAPLTPEMLQAASGKLKERHYRWLFLSVWFGLRPGEVELLKEPSSKTTWWTTTTRKGKRIYKVLWVYQPKLFGLKPEKRVKRIPCILPEQDKALTFIGTEIKAPSPKTLLKRFGKDVGLYGGRKGFVKLMKSYGQTFENVSTWMGHTDVNRTYRDYYDKQDIDFEEVA